MRRRYSANPASTQRSDLRLHFGLGKADVADLDVRWPNGQRERIARVPANRLVFIREGSGIVKTDRFTL